MQQTMSFLPIFFQIPFCYPTQLKLLIRSRHHGKKTFNLWEISSNQSWVELKKLSARKSRKLIYALNLCESFPHHRWKLFALPGKIKINRKKSKQEKLQFLIQHTAAAAVKARKNAVLSARRRKKMKNWRKKNFTGEQTRAPLKSNKKHRKCWRRDEFSSGCPIRFNDDIFMKFSLSLSLSRPSGRIEQQRALKESCHHLGTLSE